MCDFCKAAEEPTYRKVKYLDVIIHESGRCLSQLAANVLTLKIENSQYPYRYGTFHLSEKSGMSVLLLLENKWLAKSYWYLTLMNQVLRETDALTPVWSTTPQTRKFSVPKAGIVLKFPINRRHHANSALWITVAAARKVRRRQTISGTALSGRPPILQRETTRVYRRHQDRELHQGKLECLILRLILSWWMKIFHILIGKMRVGISSRMRWGTMEAIPDLFYILENWNREREGSWKSYTRSPFSTGLFFLPSSLFVSHKSCE